MEIAVVADSHIPGRAKEIPRPFLERVRNADHVVHAGDFNSIAAYEAVRELAADLTAVPGNMDSSALPLPQVATFERGGVTFVVTHGDRSRGDSEGYVADVARAEGGDVVIAGHTHSVMDTTVDDVRLLNPGSVTGAPPARRATMMTVAVADGELAVTVHELSD